MIDPKVTTPVILAGDYSQFINWCRENSVDPSLYVYYDNPMKLMGRKDFELIEVGTCYERKDYHDLVREAEFRKSLLS